MSREDSTSPRERPLAKIELPQGYNYVAAFLTLACNLRCSYCINWFAGHSGTGRTSMSGADWVRGLGRLVCRPDLPLTLQGGEPTLHPDFYRIVNGLPDELNLDLLTNLQFDVDDFMANVPPDRMRRDAPYASIRVSYHPETMDLAALKTDVLKLLAAGYSVGIWAVRHPAQIDHVEQARDECVAAGIDFRFKEFLGMHEETLYGQYAYPEAVSGTVGPPVRCRTSELVIGPDGNIYRCHADLYEDRAAIGHILDDRFRIEEVFRPCDAYGRCNPCDIKVKTNRFQEFGHTSVEIEFPD